MKSEENLLSQLKPFKARLFLSLFFMLMVSLFVGLFAIIIWPVINEVSIQNGGNLSEKGRVLRNFILA